MNPSTTRSRARRLRIGSVSAIALLTTLVAAGCADPDPGETAASGTPGNPAATSCPDTSNVKVTNDDEAILLVDRTGLLDDATRRAQQREEIDWAIDQLGTNRTASFSAAYFDSSASSVSWNKCLENVPLGGSHNNEERQAADWANRKTDFVKAVDRDITKAERFGTDIVGSMAAAAARFSPDAGHRQLIVTTDGMSSAGCAKSSAPSNGDQSGIEAIVAACDATLDLQGVDVVMTGIGRSAEPLTTGQVQWLIELNDQLCQAAGAASCSVTTYHAKAL